jgi:LacI family transcriptional regulator
MPVSHSKSGVRRVAVLVDTSTTWGRGIITGIHRQAAELGNWHLFVEARGLHDSTVMPADWRGDGIIARVADRTTAVRLRRSGIPVVNVSGVFLSGSGFPRVCNDGEEGARMAANYFLERGFRHFAYLSLRGLEYVSRQRDAFREVLGREGCKCHVMEVKAHGGFISPDWNLRLGQLGKWLSGLPKPVAVLSWGGARELVQAALGAGLRVPQEVAVLSSSDDELLDRIGPVPVSGIRASCEAIGREAVTLLDRAMRGRPVAGREIFIPPQGVTTRQSTDTLAIDDPHVVAALRHMNENLARPIQIAEVARVAGLSRRVLERRFAELLRTSPGGHLIRARLERVRLLLTQTSLPIGELAERCGFGTPEYMTSLFRRNFGSTPLRYRKEMGTAGGPR